MSCAAGRPTFRLLNSLVGWNDVRYCAKSGGWVDIVPPGKLAPEPEGVTPFSDPGGIRLELASGTSKAGVFDLATILGAFPPVRLAPGCGPGSWLLLTPGGLVLRRNPCTGRWLPLPFSRFDDRGRGPSVQHFGVRDYARAKGSPLSPGSQGEECGTAVTEAENLQAALATSVDRLAIVTPEGVQIWTIAGETQVADIPMKGAAAVAFCPYGALLVAGSDGHGNILLQRFGLDGNPLDPEPLPTKIAGPIQGLAVTPTADVGETIWLVTGSDPTTRMLSNGPIGGSFNGVGADALTNAAFPATGLVAESQYGFALQETDADGASVTSYVSWDGCTIPSSCVPLPAPPRRKVSGSITSGWIDSGISRCIWHRVRVDADMPSGTGIEVTVVTTDFDPVTSGVEPPSLDDGQTGPAGAIDLLVQQPAGQFLQLKLNLTSDGTTTPVVRSVRIDFPRRTSLDWLPAVYRENPESEDFTERFLANFDASIGDVDAAITRFPALLEPGSVPSVVLPWLGSFLGVVFDPTWSVTLQQNILKVLPQLYAQRGTIAGLTAAIKVVFGIEPAIQELASQRSWGALGDSSKAGADAPVQPNAILGSVRLFGKARTRFRLGHSALGVAPMHAYGNPDLDPLNAEAYRFEVQIPRASWKAADRARLGALIDSQKPAHTLVTVRHGGEGFVVGVWSSVGIDTAFTALPPPVLGAAGTVRLRRTSVVAEGAPRGRLPLAIGVSSVVGVQTLLK
jgi:phage tail-like protein